eukprot:g47807.t1
MNSFLRPLPPALCSSALSPACPGGSEPGPGPGPHATPGSAGGAGLGVPVSPAQAALLHGFTLGGGAAMRRLASGLVLVPVPAPAWEDACSGPAAWRNAGAWACTEFWAGSER